ncbi:hypothetical protein TNCV_16741 [Trichonephila clavipes]|nr:hypothetical protein TNCV_16741 [Trichonephila clavipes]
MEFLTFLKIPGMSRILPLVAGIRTMRPPTEGTDVSLFTKLSMRTKLMSPSVHTSEGLLEYPCSSNIPNTTAEQHAHYNSQDSCGISTSTSFSFECKFILLPRETDRK